MTIDLHKMSVSELVDRFVKLGIGQFRAELLGNIADENKLIRQMHGVFEELKSRPGDQRSALVSLYSHPNIQVRLMAAKLTLAVAPAAARQLLQAIKDSKEYPQAMDAGMCLRNLESGIFRPT